MSRVDAGIAKSLAMSVALLYLGCLAIALIALDLSPGLILALTLGAIGMVLVTLRPIVGVHLVIALLFFENAFPTAGGVTVMKVIGGVVLVAWLLHLAIRHRTGLRFNALTLAMIAFVGWSGVSLVYAIETEPAITRVLTFVQLMLIAWMIDSVTEDTSRLHVILGSIVIWTTIATGLAIILYVAGETPYAVGFVGNRNLLSLYINVGIVSAYALYQVTGNTVVKVAIAAALALLFAGLALTLSRGGFMTLTFALLVIWYKAARDKRFFILAASVAMLGAITILLPEAFWNRVESIVPAMERQEGTFGKRVELWKVGMRMIEDHPLTGVGPAGFAAAVPRYGRGRLYATRLDAHSTYVGVAAQMGLPALALFVLIMGLALREARRAEQWGRSRLDKRLAVMGMGVEVNLLVVLIASLTGSAESLKCVWILLGLALCVGRLAHGQRSEAENRGHVAALAAQPALSLPPR